ncbi:hypothetical protein ABAC460_05240 [Asticcacaulis sp. AC460]|uniref:CatB-related O-acetyltransferase n=1 Tax=Asticcacaulis sp. AC460 TaxID=1282360 RepID=UPI0003C3BD45|nr:CatB-related O-acetyltransferase [Asticcacaulis sp. AC460]ESQ91746.1 hypothetical protein ABAC460_05240 [Asticcacaulis sp. AC460]
MGFTRNQLMSRTWRYGTDRRNPIAAPVRLLPDGRIEGYSHPNEASWLLDDLGQLCFYHESGQMSLCFDTVNRVNSRIWMSGQHRFSEQPLILHLETITPGMDDGQDWTERALEEQILTHGWNIGEYTRGVPSVRNEGRSGLTIGRYSHIGTGVVINQGDPSADGVTIGSDVRIGDDAVIASGVTIGDGAVVEAGSTVTANVPPYAIVAGNPAQVTRYRHDEATIAKLLEIAWWNWPHDKVQENIAAITALDVEAIQQAAVEA